ncbi:MAG: NADH-quinone oxidoreductase subunit NuoH [Nitrospirae bacterium]|nr:NADH-quinone oxidoreductase subunit NuoH [Nitrospirota bacterium]
MLFALTVAFVKVALLVAVIMTTAAYLTFLERKISAFMQDRVGPNRVGWKGLLQPAADGLKFVFKESITPKSADRLLYNLAPVMSFVPGMLNLAIVPFGAAFVVGGREFSPQVADLDIGILYFVALASLSVYGVVLAGWSSNNKYSLLGGVRSSAQMISYELAMGLAIVCMLMIYGTLKLGEIVSAQDSILGWGVFRQPIAFAMFLVASYAETNRLPFDLPEAEGELVAGYHTEYAGFKFALFFVGEYVSMIVSSSLLVTLFFGGWQLPGVDVSGLPLILQILMPPLVFAAKTGVLLFLYMWVRWTLPRFRYDQLMNLGWKVFVPVGLVNILATGTLILARIRPFAA